MAKKNFYLLKILKVFILQSSFLWVKNLKVFHLTKDFDVWK